MSFVVVAKDNPDKLNKADTTAYLENLLTFFFSPQSVELEDNDVIWFLNYVNSLPSEDTFQDEMEFSMDEEIMCVKGDVSPLLNALSNAVAKRVLGDILTHSQGDEKLVPPLYIFHSKVKPMCKSTCPLQVT